MVIKKTVGDYLFDIFNYLLLTLLMLITLYPFLHVISGAISGPGALIGHKGALLWPKGTPTLKAFELVFRNPNIVSGYRNTIIVMVLGTMLNIFMTSLGAYVTSRQQFGIKRVMMFMIIFTMYFSGGMIPRYLFLKNYLGMGDHLGSLIIPGAISAYNLIIMRTSFASVPASLEESARIDGANDFVILFKIILPLSMATVAVMVLFYGVGHWNTWFDAMIFLRSRELYPLQLILREILVNESTESMTMGMQGDDVELLSDNLKYATIVVATLPILCIYPVIQKHFVKGVMIGAVKG